MTTKTGSVLRRLASGSLTVTTLATLVPGIASALPVQPSIQIEVVVGSKTFTSAVSSYDPVNQISPQLDFTLGSSQLAGTDWKKISSSGQDNGSYPSIAPGQAYADLSGSLTMQPVSGTTPDPATIYITEYNLTATSQNRLDSLDSFTLFTNATASIETYYDPGNHLFAAGAVRSVGATTPAVTGPTGGTTAGPEQTTPMLSLATPFSVTEMFSVTPVKNAAPHLTADLEVYAPEPISISLLGIGLVGLAGARRRK